MWNALMSVLDSWWVMGGLGVALVVLIVVYFVIKNKSEED